MQLAIYSRPEARTVAKCDVLGHKCLEFRYIHSGMSRTVHVRDGLPVAVQLSVVGDPNLRGARCVIGQDEDVVLDEIYEERGSLFPE
jgi:hypothetical protein